MIFFTTFAHFLHSFDEICAIFMIFWQNLCVFQIFFEEMCAVFMIFWQNLCGFCDLLTKFPNFFHDLLTKLERLFQFLRLIFMLSRPLKKKKFHDVHTKFSLLCEPWMKFTFIPLSSLPIFHFSFYLLTKFALFHDTYMKYSYIYTIFWQNFMFFLQPCVEIRIFSSNSLTKLANIFIWCL